MAEPLPPVAEAAEPEPPVLEVVLPALSSHVGRLRRRLGTWLRGHDLDPDAAEDVVLAASESLENCCDHAYAGAETVGAMTLVARAAADHVVVTISDDGRWREPDAGPTMRGRGLELIRELADDVQVDTASGTRVTFTRRRAPSSGATPTS